MIPTFIFEDRQEASAIWNYAINKQFISEEANVLLHVNRYVKDRSKLYVLYGVNPNEVAIADFLVPAIERGVFNRIHWLYPHQEVPPQPQWICTYSSKNGKSLTYNIFQKEEVDPQKFLQWLIKPKYKLLELQSLTTNTVFEIAESVALDIVLDYFSVDSGGSDEADKKQKIGEFVDFLKRQNIQPKLICIRRSQMSGFMQEEQWSWIEENLLRKLSEVYELQYLSLDYLWENAELRGEFREQKKAIISPLQLSEAKANGRSAADSPADEMTELNFPSGRIVIYDNLIPHELLTEIYNYYQVGLRWEFQNYGDGDDLFPSFWAIEGFPDSVCQLREIVRQKLPYKAEDPRTIVNGHVFGLGDSIHRDSDSLNNPGQTAVCYVNPLWRADWDGETKFYDHRDPSQADLIYSCLPKPGRVIIFDNTIPHRGCHPSRLCNKLRVTVAYQFPPDPNNQLLEP